jgi:hypothetical protein
MRTTVETFITFDPHTIEHDPAMDAVALVDLALAQTATVDVNALHKAAGWTLRRFNPAFAYVIAQLDDRRVLKGEADAYPARGFFLMDEDRVDLKRFAAPLRPA